MDISGWTLRLLVNSAFVQTVLKSTKGKGDQFLKFTTDWRTPQSMSFPSPCPLALGQGKDTYTLNSIELFMLRYDLQSWFSSNTRAAKKGSMGRRSTQVGGSWAEMPSKFKIHFLIWSLKHLKHTLEKDCHVRLKTKKSLVVFIYKIRKILFQRKFIKSLAAGWRSQYRWLSLDHKNRLRNLKNPAQPLRNPPELPRAIPSSRSALTVAIIFRCDKRIIPAPFPEKFMARLNRLLSNWAGGRCACPRHECWN